MMVTSSELRRLAADKTLEIGDAWNALEAAADALDAMAEPSIRAIHDDTERPRVEGMQRMTPIPTIAIFSAYPDGYRIAVNVMQIETVREQTSREKATIRTKSGDVFSVMDNFERIMSKLRVEET